MIYRIQTLRTFHLYMTCFFYVTLLSFKCFIILKLYFLIYVYLLCLLSPKPMYIFKHTVTCLELGFVCLFGCWLVFCCCTCFVLFFSLPLFYQVSIFLFCFCSHEANLKLVCQLQALLSLAHGSSAWRFAADSLLQAVARRCFSVQWPVRDWEPATQFSSWGAGSSSLQATARGQVPIPQLPCTSAGRRDTRLGSCSWVHISVSRTLSQALSQALCGCSCQMFGCHL